MPDEGDLIFRPENPGSIRKKGKKASGDVDVTTLKTLAGECEDHQQQADQHASLSVIKSPLSSPLAQWCGDESPHTLPSPASQNVDLVQQMFFNPSIEKQATVFFFNNFVLPPRNEETTRGFLEVAVPLFHASEEGSPLHLAIEAVSVSILANWPGQRHLQQRSARSYGRALQKTQKALQDPRKAHDDTTLLAILMFSLYESVTSFERSAQAWASHIEGAVALVRARGTKQFSNHQSRLLFRAVRTQMLTNAIQQRKEIPDFPGAKGWLGDVDGDRNAASSLIEHSVKLPALLAKAKPLLLSERSAMTVTEVHDMLEEAFAIQQALMHWEMQIPPEWGYRSVANRRSSAPTMDNIGKLQTWPGSAMHIYKDVHIACIRNNNRVSQILCCSVVVDALKWLNPDPMQYTLDERWVSARHRMQVLVDDICASVSFHLYGPDIEETAQASGHMRNGEQKMLEVRH